MLENCVIAAAAAGAFAGANYLIRTLLLDSRRAVVGFLMIATGGSLWAASGSSQKAASDSPDAMPKPPTCVNYANAPNDHARTLMSVNYDKSLAAWEQKQKSTGYVHPPTLSSIEPASPVPHWIWPAAATMIGAGILLVAFSLVGLYDRYWNKK
jgi:hypothetical protein